MIFTREVSAASSRFGGVMISWSTPSMRNRTRKHLLVRLEVDVGAPRRMASTRTMFTSRTTGASSADSFSSKMSALAHCSSSTLDDFDVAGGGVHLRQNLGEPAGLGLVQSIDRLPDGALGGHHRDHLKVSHEPDVVHREDVGGIGHGQGQLISRPLDRQDLVLCARSGRERA